MKWIQFISHSTHHCSTCLYSIPYELYLLASKLLFKPFLWDFRADFWSQQFPSSTDDCIILKKLQGSCFSCTSAPLLIKHLTESTFLWKKKLRAHGIVTLLILQAGKWNNTSKQAVNRTEKTGKKINHNQSGTSLILPLICFLCFLWIKYWFVRLNSQQQSLWFWNPDQHWNLKWLQLSDSLTSICCFHPTLAVTGEKPQHQWPRGRPQLTSADTAQLVGLAHEPPCRERRLLRHPSTPTPFNQRSFLAMLTEMISLVYGVIRRRDASVWDCIGSGDASYLLFLWGWSMSGQTTGTVSDGGPDPASIFSGEREARRCWITQRGHMPPSLMAVCHLISALRTTMQKSFITLTTSARRMKVDLTVQK